MRDPTSSTFLMCNMNTNHKHRVSRPELSTIEGRGWEQASQMSVSSYAIDPQKGSISQHATWPPGETLG